MSRSELSMGSNIVVISLHGVIARRERMSKLLDEKGVQFKFSTPSFATCKTLPSVRQSISIDIHDI